MRMLAWMTAAMPEAMGSGMPSQEEKNSLTSPLPPSLVERGAWSVEREERRPTSHAWPCA
jgi:hypothetical protein